MKNRTTTERSWALLYPALHAFSKWRVFSNTETLPCLLLDFTCVMFDFVVWDSSSYKSFQRGWRDLNFVKYAL